MRASGYLRLAGAIVLGIALLLAAGLFALTQGPGRALVSQLVDGRTISAIGTVGLSGLEGDILSDFRIERLTLSDEEGIWLEAEGVHLSWRAPSLLGSSIHIESVDADSLRVLRRPELERGSASSGGSTRGVRLNQLGVSDLVLEAPVLGERVTMRAHASLVSAARQGQTVTAELVRTDGASDRLIAAFTRSAEGVMEGELSVLVEADSPLAQLAYTEGRGFTLRAAVEGDRQSGEADFVFTVSDQVGIEGQGRWRDGSWRLDADTNAQAWPALPSTVQSLLSGGRLSGQGELEPRTGELRFTSAAGGYPCQPLCDPTD